MNILKPLHPTAAIVTTAQLPAVVLTAATDIERQVSRIKADIDLERRDRASAALHAIRIGEDLIALQEDLKSKQLSGIWTTIVEEQIGIPIRTAQRYIKKAKEKAKLTQALGDAATSCRLLSGRDAVEREPKKAKRK